MSREEFTIEAKTLEKILIDLTDLEGDLDSLSEILKDLTPEIEKLIDKSRPADFGSLLEMYSDIRDVLNGLKMVKKELQQNTIHSIQKAVFQTSS